MKIVWVKAGGLLPLDSGGRLRSYHILKELARRNEVTLFTFYIAQPQDAHSELKEIFSRAECIPLDIATGRSIGEALRYARNLLSSQPHNITKFCRPAVARRLRALLSEQKCDVIVCDFAVAGGVVPWDDPRPKVLFTHNVEATIWRRHYEVARNPAWKAVCWREYKTMAAAESRYLRKSDHVLAVSEADRDFFSNVVDARKITVVPTGVDLEFFTPVADQERPGAMVFTGSMDWLPNEDAIFYFSEQILPAIRRRIPSAALTVVGRNPSQRLRALAAANGGVIVIGRVPDIRPYVQTSAVYVVPLRVGGGTRLKIFEAMAMGKAVVSTSIGAEGLPVKNGVHLALADNPEEFASRVIELLESSEQRSRMGAAARELVEREYGWGAVAERFERALQGVIDAHAAHSGAASLG